MRFLSYGLLEILSYVLLPRSSEESMAHSGSSYLSSSAWCWDGTTGGDTSVSGLLPSMLDECRFLRVGVHGSCLEIGELPSRGAWKVALGAIVCCGDDS